MTTQFDLNIKPIFFLVYVDVKICMNEKYIKSMISECRNIKGLDKKR